MSDNAGSSGLSSAVNAVSTSQPSGSSSGSQSQSTSQSSSTAQAPAKPQSIGERIEAKKAKMRDALNAKPAVDGDVIDAGTEGDERGERNVIGDDEPLGEGEELAPEVDPNADPNADPADDAAPSPREAELSQQVEALQTRDADWGKAARQTLAQNTLLLERLEYVEGLLQQHGVTISPEQEQIFALRAKLVGHEIGESIAKGKQTQTSSAATTARVSALETELAAAVKAHGVDQQHLVKVWHALCEAEGKTLPFAEVAETLALRTRMRTEAPKKQAATQQVQKSRTAPRPLSGQQAGAPTPDLSTREGRAAHLKNMSGTAQGQ